MAITGRVPLLLLLGLVAVVLRPAASHGVAVAAGRASSLVGLDVAAGARARRASTVERRAAGPGAGRARRRRARSIVANTGAGAGRSARPRRLAAVGRRAPATGTGSGSPPATRRLLTTPLRPDAARRAARPLGVTLRSVGPARAGGPAAHARGRPARSRVGAAVRVAQAPARRGWPGCATSTAARRCGCAARAPSSTRCASTSAATTSARSTGGPPRATATSSSAPGSPSATAASCSCSTPRGSRPGRVDDVPRLDSAMEAALLLTALAARAGDRVDVVAGDRRVRARLRLAGARDATSRLEDALAALQPGDRRGRLDRRWPAPCSRWAGSGRWSCLLSPLEPSAVEEGLLPVLPVLVAHHRVVLASVRDPELERMAAARDGLDEVYAAAAAEQTLARRRATADLLGALGVDVIDVPARGAAARPGRPLPRPQGPRPALSGSRAGAPSRPPPARQSRGLSSDGDAVPRRRSRSPVWPRATARRPSTKT